MITSPKPTIDPALESIVKMIKMEAAESWVKGTITMKKIPKGRCEEVTQYVKDLEQWEKNGGMIPNPQVYFFSRKHILLVIPIVFFVRDFSITSIG